LHDILALAATISRHVDIDGDSGSPSKIAVKFQRFVHVMGDQNEEKNNLRFEAAKRTAQEVFNFTENAGPIVT
jgi:hypothetical protein